MVALLAADSERLKVGLTAGLSDVLRVGNLAERRALDLAVERVVP